MFRAVGRDSLSAAAVKERWDARNPEHRDVPALPLRDAVQRAAWLTERDAWRMEQSLADPQQEPPYAPRSP
jgi:hypothetical protein